MSKKDLDKIKLPNNLDNIIDDTINKANEDKKKNKERKWHKKRLGSIAAGLAIVTTIGIGTTTLVYGLPAIKSAFSQIQNGIYSKGDYSKYATEINQTINDNGVGITLSEILCDGQNLYVTYIIKSKEPFKYIKYKYDPVKDYDITKEEADKIERKQIDYKGKYKVSFSDKVLDNTGVAGLEGKFIDDNTFIGVEQFDLTSLNMKIPDEFEFTMNFDSIIEESWNSNETDDQILNGSWNFKVPVKVDKSLVKEINVNNYNKNGIGIQKILISPFEFRVFTTGFNRENNDYWVRAYDDKGNILTNIKGDSLYNSGEFVTVIARKNKNIKKMKVEIYIPYVDENGKDYFKDPRETILYSKDVNLEE